MPEKFLTAEWRKLILANYRIDPTILKKHVPHKTELDLWNDQCYVSLVGFRFQNVKVKGLTIPFHANFPEVNLRFYVRYRENNSSEWKRGVVFIKEIVPKRAITFVANTLFREHYVTMLMKHSWEANDNFLKIGYQWKFRKKWNQVSVKTTITSDPLPAGSAEEFFTEHFWGYSAVSNLKTGEYHVAHARWETYSVKEYFIDCDFKNLYGEEFSELTTRKPDSVILAEGSPVNVFMKKLI